MPADLLEIPSRGKCSLFLWTAHNTKSLMSRSDLSDPEDRFDGLLMTITMFQKEVNRFTRIKDDEIGGFF